MRVLISVSVLISLSFGLFAQGKAAKAQSAEILGDTLMQRELFAGALKQYNKAAKLTKLKDVQARQILFKRALCYFYLGETEKAIADLDIFIPENPDFPRARILRAFIYRELGDTEAQLNDLNALMEQGQVNIDLLKWRAGVLVEMEKNEEAVTALKQIMPYGTDEELELYLGLAYYGLNEADSAIVHFDKSITLNGGYLPAYLYASSLALEQEAFELALSYIKLGLMLDDENQQLLFYKGIALVEMNQKDEGCRLLQRAFNNGIDSAGDYLVEYCYPKEE